MSKESGYSYCTTHARFPRLRPCAKTEAMLEGFYAESLVLRPRLDGDHLPVVQADGANLPAIDPILAGLAEVSIVIGNADAGGWLPERGHQVVRGGPDFDARDFFDGRHFDDGLGDRCDGHGAGQGRRCRILWSGLACCAAAELRRRAGT